MLADRRNVWQCGVSIVVLVGISTMKVDGRGGRAVVALVVVMVVALLGAMVVALVIVMVVVMVVAL